MNKAVPCFILFLNFIILFYFIYFWPRRAACGILVPQLGIKPVPPRVEVWSLNHWTAKEVPGALFM